MSLDDIQHLCVKELRSELQKRGLDKNGLKATFTARLKTALDLEIAAQNADKEIERLEEGIKEQGNQVLLEILAFVKSIDKRLGCLETKKEDRDATTNTTFVEEGIVDDTILNKI